MDPVVFARIGAMDFYAGSQPGDEKPVGGGAYNQHSVGHERYNFADVGGRLYGYFQTKGGSLNLNRIKPGARDVADGVLVVFVANKIVVGWYRDARVYRTPPTLSDKLTTLREGCAYYCEAPTAQCVLLPSTARTFEIPQRAGGMGQSNVTYALNEDGRLKEVEWVTRALAYIEFYEGPNLLFDQLEEAELELEGVIQKTLATARGQRYLSDPAARKAVENYAVKAAMKYFCSLGYDVEVRGKPFDIECSNASDRLFVEVKGSQTLCAEVSLTPNEVRFARDHQREMSLFVVHSIELDAKSEGYTARGGKAILYSRWSPEPENLSPAAFVYRLPTGTEILSGWRD